jgi:phosphoenolpyruvate---glycerone phosphotransferase subunit DhaL
MSNQMTVASIQWAMGRIQAGILAHAGELNSLDGALGDGDLGVTLSRSVERFGVVSPTSDDVGMLLLEYAKLFTGTAGSTYGTLVATGLMAAAKQTKGCTAVSWSEVSSMLGAAGTAMAARGKSQLNDKTVLDVIESARVATENIGEPTQLVSAVADAVKATIAEFRMRPFKQGRARIFGEKGIGMDDPGMIAFQHVVESLLPKSP